jgi:hypothetical protein
MRLHVAVFAVLVPAPVPIPGSALAFRISHSLHKKAGYDQLQLEYL